MKKLKVFLSLLWILDISHGMLHGEKIPEGLHYSHFYLKDQTSIHLLQIKPSCFKIVLKLAENEGLETVEAMAKKNQALAAINGGFFFTCEKCLELHSGILKVEDQWHGLPYLPRGAIGWSNEPSKFVFDQVLTEVSSQNKVVVLSQSKPNYTKPSDWQSLEYILGGAPLLIQNGVQITDFSSEKTLKSFLYKKHARTAVGLLPNGDLLFVVIDGTKNLFFFNQGATMKTLATLMKDLKCKEALNLDGGGSTTLYFMGKIVNTPCGEEKNETGKFLRKVSNAILVLPK